MDWRQNKRVGIVAVVVAVIAVVVVVWMVSRPSAGTMETFICESTGRTFTVDRSPENDEYFENYMVDPGVATKCKFDDLDDAYLAFQDPETGEWRKATMEDISNPQ